MTISPTCDFDKCRFAKEFFTKKEDCFNYKETWWKDPRSSEPVLIGDCAPIRTLIMVQELSNRLVGVQKSQEEQRNRSDLVVQAFGHILKHASVSYKDTVATKLLETMDEHKS